MASKAEVQTRDDSEPVDLTSSSLSPKVKRKRSAERSEEGIKKKIRPLKRGYADPKTYAHLKGLNDVLAPFLDVVFCGINPGCMSATKGHHFANPTNHFWKALHLSGFTPRQLPPSEDATISAVYSLGLTNLVERASAEQAELSKTEMKLSVPSLKAKIIRYRPRIVCFVGKEIWLTVESAFKKEIKEDQGKSDLVDKFATAQSGGTYLTPPPTPAKLSSKHNTTGRRTATKPFAWGIQSYKLVYVGTNSTLEKDDQILGDDPFVATTTLASVHETLFFVMPSTSGRVVSHQLGDKVKLFTQLRHDLDRIKSGTLDTTSMVIIPSN